MKGQTKMKFDVSRLLNQFSNDYDIKLTYSPFPPTLDIVKREREEEQYRKYSIRKEKQCEIL